MNKKQTNHVGPYSFIAGFGLVSMFMDIVYEGALSIQGPLLLSLGASSALVGIVSGLGEATSLAGRLVSGPAADRTGRYWLFALLGYLVTAIAVPSMGIIGSVAGVSALIIIERLGKSLRTPSRDAMLSHASAAVGRGKGFALHEVLDQIGAMCGPLIVAAILWATSNNYAPALGVLAIPAVIAISILLRLRIRVPNPSEYESAAYESATASEPSGASDKAEGAQNADAARKPASRTTLPRVFWVYAALCGLSLSGVATFAVMSYHMVSQDLLPAAAVPIVYALAMGVDAVAAWATGTLYDRIGPKTLLALPILSACIPWFAYGSSVAAVVTGTVLWGLTTGVQESTMRAYVADLVPSNKRASSYGMFSVFTGVGTLLGGAIAGTLYGSVGAFAIVAWTMVVQAVVFLALAMLFRRQSRANAQQD